MTAFSFTAPPAAKRHSHSLEASLQRRLIPIIERYQTQIKNESSDLSSREQERELWNLESIFIFALSLDASLKRKPSKGVRKALEGAILTLKSQRSLDQLESDGMDSEFEFDPNIQMVKVQDTNFLNRSLLNVYNQNKAGEDAIKQSSNDENTQESLTVETPVMESSEPKVTKRRSAHPGKSSDGKKIKKIAPTQCDKWPAPSARLSDLGGIDTVVDEILQLIGMPLKHPEVYSHLGINPPRGVLLHGPPGCGKTMLANAIAGEFEVPFINISAPSIVSGMSGESEKKIREVFEEAKDMAPCILFIDEIDAITPKRETAQREMERRIVAQLLTCMDDVSFEKMDMKPVMIIGATNRPDALDPALRRAGRFDREIGMGVPDEAARARILEKLSAKLKLEGDFDFLRLAKLTPGYVGADLNALTSEAGMIAVQRVLETLGASTENCDNLMDVMEEDEANPMTPLQPPAIQTLVSNFMELRSTPLSPEELETLCITHDDFVKALKKVQPSAKREGFATVPGVSWDDIGALSKVRDELRMAIVEPVRHPEYFVSVGISSPMGVLLYGPPGCGKTLLAKAVANESHCNFISVKGPELLNKYVGESERAVRMVFARASASAPCVIFFDELDALCPSRSNDSESQSSSRLVNTLLTEMDGMQGRKQVYVIAATNRPDMIDPAMLRPGRLDKTLYVDLPNHQERLEILKTLTRKTPLDADVQLNDIADDERCDGYSGADLAALVREAAVTALRSTIYAQGSHMMEKSSECQITVKHSHFLDSFSKIPPSVGKRDRKRYELLKIKFGSATNGNLNTSGDSPTQE